MAKQTFYDQTQYIIVYDQTQYIIEVLSSKKLFTKQKYFWRIKDYHNHKILLSSENYANKLDCIEVAEKLSANLKLSVFRNFINE